MFGEILDFGRDPGFMRATERFPRHHLANDEYLPHHSTVAAVQDRGCSRRIQKPAARERHHVRFESERKSHLRDWEEHPVFRREQVGSPGIWYSQVFTWYSATAGRTRSFIPPRRRVGFTSQQHQETGLCHDRTWTTAFLSFRCSNLAGSGLEVLR